MMHDYDFHRNWSYYVNKQKKRGKLHVVPIFLKVFKVIFSNLEEEQKDIIII